MPTLTRLLTFVALCAGAILAAMAALVAFVEPTPAPVSFEVPIPALAEPAPPARTGAAPVGVASPDGVFDQAGSVIAGPPEGERP